MINKYFFAEENADLYDSTIELAVPYYKLIHSTMIDIMKIFIDNKSEGSILNIGTGTGTELIKILKTFPNLDAIALDICEPMKIEFEKNYNKENFKNIRYKYIIQDFLSNLNSNYDYLDLIKDKGGFVSIVSAYCIHHFTNKNKYLTYEKAFSLLKKGGFLINVDLFNYDSIKFKSFAHQFDINYINKEFNSPSSEFINCKNIPYNDRQLLKGKWIRHMEEENILESIEIQSQMLKDIGFRIVEIPFRYWQQGILCAVK